MRDFTGTIRILDAESLAELRRFDMALPGAGDVAWNPADTQQILVSNGTAYRLLNQETGETGPVTPMFNSQLWPVWHPDGRKVAPLGGG